MARTIKDRAEAAGHRIAETATKAGHKVAETVEHVTDWAKQKAHQAGHRMEETKQKAGHTMQETFGDSSARANMAADIREHMLVVGSCGNMVGRVDHVEGSKIKLTRNDSPDGLHHFIPTSWVDRVDDRVHLDRDCGEAHAQWQSE